MKMKTDTLKQNRRKEHEKNCPVCTVQRIRREEFECLAIRLPNDIPDLREMISQVVEFGVRIVNMIQRRVKRTQLNDKKVC